MIYLFKYILNCEKNEKDYEESKGIHYLKDAILRAFPTENINILKDERGKPVTDRRDVFVSVSHAGNIVICGISDMPIGVDSEVPREKIKIKKIAERFFTDNEILKIEREGESAFYEIWCRKEAYSKVEGRGLSYGIKKIKTVSDNTVYNEEIGFLNKINGISIIGSRIEEGYFACAGGRGEVSWTEIRE